MCSGSAMCGNSTTFKGKSGSHWGGMDLRLWADSSALAGGGSERAGERGWHGVDKGLGQNVVGELLDSGSLSRRDAGRKRHAGLAASNLEHASGCPGKALHEWQPKRRGQAAGLRLRLAREVVGAARLEGGAKPRAP